MAVAAVEASAQMAAKSLPETEAMEAAAYWPLPQLAEAEVEAEAKAAADSPRLQAKEAD